MKRALLVIAVVMLSACEPVVAFVDIDRAMNECSDGKNLHSELRAFDEARQRAKAAPPLNIQSDDEWQAQRQAKINAAAPLILARIRRILPAVAKARRVGSLGAMSTVVYVRPELDATAELVRRYDAGEGVEDKSAELAAARAKVEALERESKGKAPARN